MNTKNQGGQWTRDDLPELEEFAGSSDPGLGLAFGRVLNSVVAHLNAHHPKPGDAARIEAEVRRRTVALRENLHGVEKSRDEWERKYHEVRREFADEQGRNWERHAAEARIEQAERERDAAAARAEAAERELDALRKEQWAPDDIKPGDDVVYLGNWYGSSPCPRGAVFTVRAVHEGSGRVSFDWPGVDGACVDLSRVRKVEIAAPLPAPAVSRDDIEKAIRDEFLDWESQLAVRISRAVNHAWSLVSGADPAVHVVWESDIDAVKVERSHRGWDTEKCAYTGDATAQEARSGAKRNIDYAIACEAIARAIEAEAAVDTVETKAEEIFGVAHPGARWQFMDRHTQDRYIRIARHVLGREASSDE